MGKPRGQHKEVKLKGETKKKKYQVKAKNKETIGFGFPWSARGISYR
jgi:hypothetical protein